MATKKKDEALEAEAPADVTPADEMVEAVEDVVEETVESVESVEEDIPVVAASGPVYGWVEGGSRRCVSTAAPSGLEAKITTNETEVARALSAPGKVFARPVFDVDAPLREQ